MREIELSGSVGPGWPTPNSWERRRRRRRRRRRKRIPKGKFYKTVARRRRCTSYNVRQNMGR